MPESKGRDKKSYTPPRTASKVKVGNPSWYVPVMVALMLVGLLWIVVFYLSSSQFPLPQLGRWNLGIGFGFLLVGFAMTTRWR